ncbi:MAG: hypothetical protein ACPF9F_03135 [Acholeplasmataceae bacterium]
MKNYVENQLLGKFFRTIGYALLFVSSSLISLALVFEPSADFIMIDRIRDTLQPVQDFVLSVDLIQDSFYYLFLFLIGMVLIFWTLVKSTFVKLVQTLVLVVLFALIFHTQDKTLIPISFSNPTWITDSLAMVDSYINQLLALSEDFVMPLAALLGTLVIWQVFATKKPKRLSTLTMRVGSVILFLAVLFFFAGLAFEDFLDTSIVDNIRGYAYVLSFDLFVLGSAFGILGFMRK